MDYKTLTTPEIIKAILCRDSVPDAVKSLIRQKENEFSRYKDNLNREEQSTRLLVEALELPQGTAGREIADGIVGELRKLFPEIAREADERFRQKKELEDLEIERICRH